MDIEGILAYMTPIHWVFIGLLWLGLFAFLWLLAARHWERSARLAVGWEMDQSPALLYESLRERPDQRSPADIVKVLGCEGTLNLLEEGDARTEPGWRYRWAPVREGLLSTLSEQNAFAPVDALSRYYGVASHMHDATRIRRTVLVHKLGRAMFLDPGENGSSASLVVHRNEDEPEAAGDIDFPGPVVWGAVHSQNGTEQLPPGPVVELGPIQFQGEDHAEVEMKVQRGPLVGGGFRLCLERRRGHWIVVEDELLWVT